MLVSENRKRRLKSLLHTLSIRTKPKKGFRSRRRRETAKRETRALLSVLRKKRARQRYVPHLEKPPPSEELQIQVDEVELTSALCRESFYDFVKEMWSIVSQEEPVWNWHIEYLCNEIQRLAELVFQGKEKEYDLCVNIPPGTTKSTIISVMLPAWVWVRMPRAKFICASYSEKLARDDLSVKTRDIVLSDNYQTLFPEIVLREDQNAKGLFANTLGGWRYAVGVGGTVTGKHAHFILIDDPLNPEEAQSEASLKTANRWLKDTVSNRKVDKRVTLTILVMQRLHEDDPTAQFLKRKNVRHIKLPAEVEDGPIPFELSEKYIDGLLDFVRMGRKALAEEKAKGEYYYSSQFRQSPSPPSGNMFKVTRIKEGEPPTQFSLMVRFWDKAGTKNGGAYTVGTLIAIDKENRFWVLDVIRVQLDSYEREKLIEKTAKEDGAHVLVGLEQEPGSGGKESVENTVKRLRGYKVKWIKVDASTGGKVERADPFSTQVNAGNVYVPYNQDWVEIWKEELKMFPNSKYKDQVDSVSGGFMFLNKPKKRAGGCYRPSY